MLYFRFFEMMTSAPQRMKPSLRCYFECLKEIIRSQSGISIFQFSRSNSRCPCDSGWSKRHSRVKFPFSSIFRYSWCGVLASVSINMGVVDELFQTHSNRWLLISILRINRSRDGMMREREREREREGERERDCRWERDNERKGEITR